MVAADCHRWTLVGFCLSSLCLSEYGTMAFSPQLHHRSPQQQQRKHKTQLFMSSTASRTTTTAAAAATTTTTTTTERTNTNIVSDSVAAAEKMASTKSAGHAYDVIMIHSQETGRITCSDFMLEVDPLYNRQVLLEIVVPEGGEKVYFPIMEEPPKVDLSLPRRLRKLQGPVRKLQHPIQFDDQGNARRLYLESPEELELARGEQQELQQQQLVMSMLKSYLQPGANAVRYIFMEDGRVNSMASAQMFLWSDKDRVVVCDVDGTITKSNVRGVVNTIVRERFKKHIHPGVCHFFSHLLKETNEKNAIEDNDDNDEEGTVRVLYVTSRPISLVEYTRKLLTNLEQDYLDDDDDDVETVTKSSSSSSKKSVTTPAAAAADVACTCDSMPSGPLMGFSGSLRRVLKMELLSHSVHWFKSKLLFDQVVSRFRSVQSEEDSHRNVFLAGFGNSVMDMKAYHMAGMDLDQIYWIDKQSEISCLDSHHHHHHHGDNNEEMVIPLSSPSSNGVVDTLFDSTDPFIGSSSRAAETAAEEIIATTMMEAASVMKQPLGKSDYKSLRGTRFEAGYEDASLISHVLAETK